MFPRTPHVLKDPHVLDIGGPFLSSLTISQRVRRIDYEKTNFFLCSETARCMQGCKIWNGNIIAHRNSIIVMAAAPPINYCNNGNYGKIGVSMVNSTKLLNKKLDFTSEKSSLYSKLLQLC